MAEQAPAAAPSLLQMLPMLAVPILIFYVLVFRPQARSAKEREGMLKQLKKNDEVVTSGGLFGTVVNIKPDAVTLRIAENVRVDVERSAIARVVKARAAELGGADKRSEPVTR